MNTARTAHQARWMLTFARIVECGGISAAAVQLGLDKAAVSRQLRDLEDSLDIRLMHRSTRRLTLTEVGAVVYERAQRIVHELEQAHMEAQALRSLRGRARVHPRPCGGVDEQRDVHPTPGP